MAKKRPDLDMICGRLRRNAGGLEIGMGDPDHLTGTERTDINRSSVAVYKSDARSCDRGSQIRFVTLYGGRKRNVRLVFSKKKKP